MVREWSSLGTRWQVRDSGTGADTLVFLPGLLGTVDVFNQQVAALSPHCRVVVLGYPGSSALDTLSESFWALLQTLDVQRPYLIGSSLGAYLLQHFTSRSGHDAQGLLLGNTFVDSHRLRFIRMFDPAFIDHVTASEAKAAWVDFVGGIRFDPLRSALLPMVRDRQPDDELLGRSRAIAHLGPVARSVLPPERIALLSCADDPVSTPAVTREVVAAYPGSRHIALAAGAHYPHLVDPQAYQAALFEALPGLAQGTGLPSSAG